MIHPLLTFLVAALTLPLVQPTSASAAETLRGRLDFEAVTNVNMFHFAGGASFASPLERKGASLSHLEIRIPIKDLTTGMDIRDKHMRERVFTADDGTTPDLVFKSASSSCTGPEDAGERACTVSGSLDFRGKSNPVEFKLSLRGGKKASGTMSIDVLAYGVKPEQLKWTNIKVTPAVPVRFEASIE